MTVVSQDEASAARWIPHTERLTVNHRADTRLEVRGWRVGQLLQNWIAPFATR
jgi:hypothetical protein